MARALSSKEMPNYTTPRVLKIRYNYMYQNLIFDSQMSGYEQVFESLCVLVPGETGQALASNNAASVASVRAGMPCIFTREQDDRQLLNGGRAGFAQRYAMRTLATSPKSIDDRALAAEERRDCASTREERRWGFWVGKEETRMPLKRVRSKVGLS